MADSSPECSFCRLDEPAVTMYRDATVQAFISLAPINRYHVIVAPRAHYEHLSELPTTTVTTAVAGTAPECGNHRRGPAGRAHFAFGRGPDGSNAQPDRTLEAAPCSAI